ncbi:MMPL domain protein (plasmid) [Streptomyces clavuligerus]|uniref:MMPL domain protein n=2 Tax=Streptomyces clavuligerus TaxID=1901 RepID=D5SJA5_STRCL|nr:MMPL domain protein [Streptomyces clavuligerus]
MRAVGEGPMSAATHDGRAARAVAAVSRACVRHRFVVIGAWLLVVAALMTGAKVLGTPTDNDVSLPGTDSQLVRDLSVTPPTSGIVIVTAPAGRLDDGTRSRALAATAASLRRVAHVTVVKPPSAKEGSLAADGRTGWFTIGMDVRRADLTEQRARAVMDSARPAADAGLRPMPGAAFAQAIDGSGGHRTEYLGLTLAALVLFFTLGGLLGAILPLLTSALSLIATLATIGLAGNATSIPTVATTIATMVGLGVGIDYALFVLSRFRESARADLPVPEAIGRALGDSGTAVAFAGVTVAVALAGLGLTEVPLLQTLAWTSGIAVLFAVLSTLTLLPALTSLAGRRLARGGVLCNRLSRGLRRRAGSTGDGGYWARQADRVTRRPWLAGGSALVLLALLTAPAADLRLGQLDAGSSPSSTAVRQADDVISEAFGPGTGSPLTVLGRLPTPATDAGDPRVAQFVAEVRTQPGVAFVGPVTSSSDGRVVTVSAISSASGGDSATADLVHRLRGLSVPGVAVHVGGTTAARVDLAERVTSKLPVVIGVVLLLSVSVLLLAFRAPLVALKAAVMDVVSVGAAYGALTAVFTWGWGVTWLGLSGPVPIPSYVPLMLFALLFGLSMDYEVFLLSVVQQRWNISKDNLRSVREGLTATGGVITAAAMIMIGVFLAFVSNNDPTIKMFGTGMAVAIAVDVTVVRGLLVPATMALLGDLTWWTPRRRRAEDLHRAEAA